MGGISTLSLISFNLDYTQGIELQYSDKIVHFVFHCISMLLGGLAVRKQFKSTTPFGKPFIFMIVGLFLYGITIEGLQAILPTGRSAELLDVLSNSLGLVAGVLILKLLFKKQESKMQG